MMIWLVMIQSDILFVPIIGMGNSVMQTQHKLGAFGTNVMHGFSGHNSTLRVLCFISLST